MITGMRMRLQGLQSLAHSVERINVLFILKLAGSYSSWFR